MTNKVYELSANLDGMDWGSTTGDFVQKRDDLGFAISALALAKNETVYYHDYKGDVGGAPVVLLECSEAFLEKIKKLPEFGSVRPASLPTERKTSIQDYFEDLGMPPGGCVPPEEPKMPPGGCIPPSEKPKKGPRP